MVQSSTYLETGYEYTSESYSSTRNHDPEPFEPSEGEISPHEDSSTASTSSTVIYEQEPFESFRKRVEKFAESTWPKCSPDNITIEKMKGGGFNRIICITLHPSLAVVDGDYAHKYILRLPRFDAARLDRDVAALLFVRRMETIPVPEIVAFDETDKNILGSPYMLQRKLPGCDLYNHFHILDHQFKCRLARDLGLIFNHMLSIRSQSAGVLVLPPEDKSLEAVVQVAPFLEKSTKQSAIFSGVSQCSMRDLLLKSFNERMTDDSEKYPSDTLRPRLTEAFLTMTLQLHEDGWFADNWICLCHLDLAPRNILINIEPGLESRSRPVAGILDWDSAVLAPSFLSCAPPLWLWAWNDEEDEDERTANNVPSTEEGRELKRIFEEAAGLHYVRFAYPDAYRLARRLVLFAINGIRSSEDVNEAYAMLQEWEEIRSSLPK